jgi:hypothetical protein
MDSASPCPAKLDEWQRDFFAAIRENRAIQGASWSDYDEELRRITVPAFNAHLGATPKYIALDWRRIRALLWVETGAWNTAWKTAPIRLWENSAELKTLLEGAEGRRLMPIEFLQRLDQQSVFHDPIANLRAGIALWLIQTARFERNAQGALTLLGWHYGLPATTVVCFSRASTDPYYAQKIAFARKLSCAWIASERQNAAQPESRREGRGKK